MLSFPNAKINLGLYITRKREDGFHNLETCFYPIPWTDGLEVVPAAEVKFTSSGLAIPGNPDQNLCLRAYRLLAQKHELPLAHIHLHKVLPTGAGLGGGSADAAFTLLNLNKLFELNLSESKLEEYARQLGSDCAFFIRNKPVFASGRGDVFEPLEVNLSGWQVLVVHPGLHISTQEAYSRIKPKPATTDLRKALLQQPETWKELVKNDFEEALFPVYPLLSELKDQLYKMGAVYAAMSGSGSAVFGLFRKAVKVNDEFPAGYLVWEGKL